MYQDKTWYGVIVIIMSDDGGVTCTHICQYCPGGLAYLVHVFPPWCDHLHCHLVHIDVGINLAQHVCLAPWH